MPDPDRLARQHAETKLLLAAQVRQVHAANAEIADLQAQLAQAVQERDYYFAIVDASVGETRRLNDVVEAAWRCRHAATLMTQCGETGSPPWKAALEEGAKATVDLYRALDHLPRTTPPP